jgi:hypothetical protein
MMSGEPITEDDRKLINMMLYAPSILIRERLPIASRFQRMISTLKTMELVYKELGNKAFADTIREEFGSLFKGAILRSSSKSSIG